MSNKRKKEISYIDMLLVVALIILFLDVFNIIDETLIVFAGFILMLTTLGIVIDCVVRVITIKLGGRKK